MDILKKHNISDADLLSDNCMKLNDSSCTNEFIIALYNKSKRLAAGHSQSKVLTWTSKFFDVVITGNSANTFNVKVRKVVKEYMKRRGQYRIDYGKEKFHIPTSTVTTAVSADKKFDITDILATELIKSEDTLTASTSKVQEMRNVIQEKNVQKRILHRKLQRHHKQLQKTKGDIALLKNTPKLVKRLQRSLLYKSKHLQIEMTKKKQLYQKLREQQRTLREKTAEAAGLALRLHEMTGVIDQCQIAVNESMKSKCDDTIQIKQLKEENEYLNTLLNDDCKLETFDQEHNCFNPQLVECVMNITDCNVAANKVSKVIEHVSKLCGKEPSKLPSEMTVNRINLRKASLAQKQLEQVATQENLTLYSDETSKFGKSFEVYAVTDLEKTSYLLGLREMANKSSVTVLETLKDILTDINEACIESSTVAGSRILASIKNTMSDRAATEKKFHELLEKYRLEILPLVMESWDSMAGNEQQACSTINNFFCGLHLLVGCADMCATTMKQFEKLKHMSTSTSDFEESESENVDEISTEKGRGGESGTVRLIRCCSKAFARGADEKSGVHGAWKTYLEGEKQKVLFQAFKHNRFNIIFMLGGIVYYHRDRITHFLENVHGVVNGLLEQINSDLKNDTFIAGCRAFGLISKQITAPLWRLIEGKLHILEMNQQYLDLCTFLETMKDGSNAERFVAGDHTPFGTFIEQDDIVHRELTKACPLDGLTADILQVLCESLLALLQRQLADQLPGGKYAQFSDELKVQSASTMKHNKLPEFFFGQLDFLLKYRPNASLLCNEAFLMFSHNKTGNWLQSLPQSKRECLIEDSRKHGQQIKKMFNERLANIKIARQQALREKEESIKVKREKLLKGKENLTILISYYGLWQSDIDISTKLAEITTATEKRKALQVQLNFRKKVLHQKSLEPNIFSFSGKDESGKNRQFPLSKLESNLRRLINEAFSRPTQAEVITANRPLLVGKRIEHKFSDDVSYTGTVISVVPGYPAWYNIKYDHDAESLYVYDLLADYASGDLKIII